MLILFGLNYKLLEKAGYSRVMSHSYGKQHEQEWITNKTWNRNGFPRFHCIKDKGEWSLHWDYYPRGADKHHSDVKSQIVRNERNRLKRLSKELMFASLARKK